MRKLEISAQPLSQGSLTQVGARLSSMSMLNVATQHRARLRYAGLAFGRRSSRLVARFED
jgi:hypothetical protein